MIIDRIEIKKDFLPYDDLIIDFTKDNVTGNEMLIFGRNGTGKTTISNSIYEGTRTGNSTMDIKFIKNNKIINARNINEDNVFVFNESFMDEKVKFTTNNNLEAIVMLGEQGEYQELLKVYSKRLHRINIKHTKYLEKIDKFNKEEALNKVKKLLRGKGSWAERELKIRPGKINPEVTNDTVEIIMDTLHDDQNNTESDLIKELHQISEKLVDVNQRVNIEEFTYESFYNPFFYENTQDLLSRDLSINEVNSDIDNKIRMIFNVFGKQELNRATEYLDTDAEYCKTCFRELDKEYKDYIKEKILDTINQDTVQKIEREIDKQIDLLPNHTEVVEYNEVVPNYLVDLLNESIANVNRENNQIKNLLLKKKKNMNRVQFIETGKLKEAYTALEGNSANYNRAINEYNDNFLKLDDTIKNYSDVNKRLAYKEIKNSYNDFQNKLKTDEFNIYMRTKIYKIEKKIQDKVRDFKSKLSETKIALDDINKTLSLIFYDRKRLELIDENGYYSVKVRDRKTPLNKLSTGEKNVIGLSYFFSLLHIGKTIRQKYQDKILIVLDDPISSFDFENKMGIYNYLRRELELILTSNRESQILITTHDAEVFSSFDKLLIDIKDNGKPIIKNLNRRLLTNEGLIDTKRILNNTYTEQLESVYKFAVGINQDELVNYIGNTMRRVFESYSTFNYKCGVTELIRNEDILDKLQDDKEREFFGNLMIRLLLNNESHGQYQAQYSTDLSVYDFLSLEEKVRTAKLLILYLYRLDDIHVKTHLKGVNNNIDFKIEEWKELIN